MRQLTASQKIAVLEHRIARLEKQASWTDYFGRFPLIRAKVIDVAKMIEVLFKKRGMSIRLSKLKRGKETLYGKKVVSLTYTFPLDGQTYKLRFLAAEPSLWDDITFDDTIRLDSRLALRFEKSGKVSKDVIISTKARKFFWFKASEVLKAFESVR